MVSLPWQLMSMARNNQQENMGEEVSAEILVNDRFWPKAAVPEVWLGCPLASNFIVLCPTLLLVHS